MSGRRRTRTLREMGPRPQTLRARELLRQIERQAEPLFDWAMPSADIPAPRTRGDCEPCETCQAFIDQGGDGRGLLICRHKAERAINHCRPCVRVSCRHHLYIDVKDSGHLRLNFPGKEIDELQHTCSLDVVDGQELTLEQVGDRVNLTRERVRIIQDEAYERLERMLKAGDYDDE